MWDKDMGANENVELLVEKLLDEEVARLMAANDESDDVELEGFDDGEEMVGGIDDQPSDRDALGLNRAKATVLAGEKITSQPQQEQKTTFNLPMMDSAANNARNNAYGKRYEDPFDDDFDTDRAPAGSKRNDLNDSWDGEF